MTDKRYLKFNGIDKEIEISKYTVIKNSRFKSLHIDELDDGTFRLIVGEGLVDDLSKVESMEIVRVDSNG